MKSLLWMVLLACGCAGLADDQGLDADELGDVEQADEIDPTATETLGRIRVDAPAWPTGGKAVAPGTVRYRSSALTLGQSLRIKEGTGCVTLNAPPFGTVNRCEVVVKPKLTRRVRLAGVYPHWDVGATSAMTVDLGPTPKLTLLRDTAVLSTPGTAEWTGTPLYNHLAVAGKYTVSYGIAAIPDKSFTLTPGKFKDVDLTPPDLRAALKVVAPTRKYPNPVPAQCEGALRNFVVEREKDATATSFEPHPYDLQYPNSGYSKNLGIRSYLPLDLQKTTTVHAFPHLTAEAPLRYEYVVNNLVLPLELEAGKTFTVNVKRIDVNDVFVTREDGTTAYVAGNYSVSRKNAVGVYEPVTVTQSSYYPSCTGAAAKGRNVFPTKTGIDVLPGDYRVVISFTTEEGPQTQQHDITLQ